MAMNHLTTFIPEKLDVDAINYSSWVYYFSHLCHGYGILDHLVDSVASSSTTTPTDPPPKDAEWTKIDFILTLHCQGCMDIYCGNDDVVTFTLEGLPSTYETISTVIVSRKSTLLLRTSSSASSVPDVTLSDLDMLQSLLAKFGLNAPNTFTTSPQVAYMVSVPPGFLSVRNKQEKDKIGTKLDKNGKRGEARKSQELKKAQEKDKIGSKPDKNGKRGELGKS
nr:hybrid signal transduction histidine kinase M [Tanacetum cinerariifolium]